MLNETELELLNQCISIRLRAADLLKQLEPALQRERVRIQTYLERAAWVQDTVFNFIDTEDIFGGVHVRYKTSKPVLTDCLDYIGYMDCYYYLEKEYIETQITLELLSDGSVLISGFKRPVNNFITNNGGVFDGR